MKKYKSVLFSMCVMAVIGLTILFGYWGFKKEEAKETFKLSYADEIVVEDGTPKITHSGTEFTNQECEKCILHVKWGDSKEKYTFISMVKIVSPSGKVVAFVTGDTADSELAFLLEEKGTYKVESEYYFDGYEFCEEVQHLWPEGELLEVAEDGSVDGFIFSNQDGKWTQSYDLEIIISK